MLKVSLPDAPRGVYPPLFAAFYDFILRSLSALADIDGRATGVLQPIAVRATANRRRSAR